MRLLAALSLLLVSVSFSPSGVAMSADPTRSVDIIGVVIGSYRQYGRPATRS